MSLALGYVLFIHWPKVKSHGQAHRASWSACIRAFTLPSLARSRIPSQPGSTASQCRCRCSANDAGLFVGQPLHMLTKHRTLYLEWCSWESYHHMKNRARKMPIPTRSLWDLLRSTVQVWLQKLQVQFSALPCASCVLGQVTAPSSNSLTLKSCYKDNWESIF